MSDPRIGSLLRHASRLAGRSRTADAALLARLSRGDSEALAELLARHGPNVWALCRRITRSEADAEDVFQATFLVLARDASRVRKAASVGSWLYGVAARIGRKAREKGRRTPDPARLPAGARQTDPALELSWREVRAALDEELGRLPDALRAPLLLCYFDGMTHDEVAAELGWSPRTVKARVARGRDLLRKCLTRRGIELPTALAVPLLSANLAPAVPPHFPAALASHLSRGRVPGPGVAPAAVALARSETPAMSLLRLAILVVSAAGLLAAGSLAGLPRESTAAGPEAQPARDAEPALPVGAVRIGSTHFRQTGWHSRVFVTDGGRTLITAGEGALARFWDVETGKKVHEITHGGGYQDAAFSPAANLLAVVGVNLPDGDRNKADTALWLIDTTNRKVVHTIPMPGNHGGNSQKVEVSADGKRVVVEYEGDVRVIDAKSGEELMRHKGRINAGALALSRDGKTIAFGRYDVYLWQWESGEEPKKFAPVGGFGTELLGFSPDGKTLLVVAHSNRVTAFDTATGRQTGTFDFADTPWKWSFSPDGKSLATAYYDSSRINSLSHFVVLWDPTTGKEQARFPLGRTKASHVSWSADGSLLAAATDYRLWVWDVKTKKPLGPSSDGHEGTISAFAFGPDGRLFSASDDYTVRSWDAATGKPGLTLVHDYWVRDVAVSPDGSLVAGSALRNDLRIWDAKTGAQRFKLLGNGSLGGRRRVRFTPDGKRLIAWGDDQYLRVFDTRNGKLLAEHSTYKGERPDEWADPFSSRMEMMALNSADISADGATFVIGSWDKSVRVFDVASGKERMSFEGDPGGVTAVSLSPDGKRLAVAGRAKQVETRLPGGRTQSSPEKDHQVTVWDLATKTVVWKDRSDGSWAAAIHFSPDGSRVAESTYGQDKRHAIRVWDAATGKDLGRIELTHSGGHFAFDRTGKKIAVSHQDTTATVYDLETALKPPAQK